MPRWIDHPRDYRDASDAGLEAALRRFHELSARDQLRAFNAVREFLGASAPTETSAEAEIRQRAEALEEISLVCKHRGLNGKAPTAQQFDETARELGLDWTARRVGLAWGRWRFACDAYRGQPPRLTAAQRSLRAKHSGFKRNHEDYLTALRLWFATKPALDRAEDYDAWAREHNARLGEDEAPVPGSATIRTSFALSWHDALRVGRGELAIEGAPKLVRAPREDSTTGPHDLIGLRSAARILRVSTTHCEYLSRLQGFGFPTPVAIFFKARAWLRGDVETYARMGRAPERTRNALRHLYYDSREIVELVALSSTKNAAHERVAPPVTGRVAGHCYWLKRDADAWAEANKERIERRKVRLRRRADGTGGPRGGVPRKRR